MVAFKYHLIGTPLERPLRLVQALFKIPHRLRHPELKELYKEDRRVSAVFKRILGPDSVYLDVGAHYGRMLAEVRRIYPTIRLIAVEAVPEKCNFLRTKFSGCVVHNCAIADTQMDQDFFINIARPGYSGLAKHGLPQDRRYEKVKVKCRTLDDLMSDIDRCDLLKIDVEGAEYRVLKGAEGVLVRCRPLIVFEWTKSAIKAHNVSISDLYGLLTEDFQYDVFYIKDWLKGGEPVELGFIEQALTYPFQSHSWVAQAR